MRPVLYLKNKLKLLRALGFIPNIDSKYTSVRLGSKYGGWNVILDLLDPKSVIYSFGIGEDATFDMALIDQLGVTIQAFDPTPKSIEWVRRQNFPSSFVLHEYGLSTYDGIATFYPPKDPKHVSHTVVDAGQDPQLKIEFPVKSLQTIQKELGNSHIDLLKADIEGSEYPFIEDLAKGTIRPTQLLFEFHHRFRGVGANQTKQAFNQLRAMGYELFSISNSAEEFGFVLPHATK